jgi:hypothetical protein
MLTTTTRSCHAWCVARGSHYVRPTWSAYARSPSGETSDAKGMSARPPLHPDGHEAWATILNEGEPREDDPARGGRVADWCPVPGRRVLGQGLGQGRTVRRGRLSWPGAARRESTLGSTLFQAHLSSHALMIKSKVYLSLEQHLFSASEQLFQPLERFLLHLVQLPS